MDVTVSEDEILEKECNLYSDYKTELKGRPHPSPIQEGTALSWVDPPNVDYVFSIPEEFIEPTDSSPALLSGPQLSAIKYASLAHNAFLPGSTTRQGFLLGDGTGMGKSRTIAGIILEYGKKGVCGRALWISVNEMLASSVLKEIHKLVPYARFKTLKAATMDKQNQSKKIIMYCTYTQLSVESYFKELIHWMGDNYDGLIIFDEAHMAKNSGRSIVGNKVVWLQKTHPNARVIYSTATSAYEPRHLMYMERLPLWGAGCMFKSKEEFKTQMDLRPTTAMELVSMKLKETGVFLSRQLSFKGITFHPEVVPASEVDKIIYNRCTLLAQMIFSYLDAFVTTKGARARYFSSCQRFFLCLIVSTKIKTVAEVTRRELAAGRSVVIGLQHTGEASFTHFKNHEREGQAHSAVEYTLREMMGTVDIYDDCGKWYLQNGDVEEKKYWVNKKGGKSKNNNTDSSTDEDVNSGESSDSESNLEDESYSESESSSSDEECNSGSEKVYASPGSNNPKDDERPAKKPKLQTVVEFSSYMVGFSSKWAASDLAWSYFEYNDYKCSCSNSGSVEERIGEASYAVKVQMDLRKKILRLFHEIVPFLPINPLDELRDRLKDIPLVELTSRTSTYERDENDEKVWCRYGKVATQQSKMIDVDKFMNGDCRVAIISDASSVGISLHADPEKTNDQPRTHITIELPWAADKYTQQTGRTHRTGERWPTAYVLIKSWVPAEIRCLSVVAKRLAQLGAICNAQSKGNILSQDFVDIDLCNRMGVVLIKVAAGKLKIPFIAMPPDIGRLNKPEMYVSSFFNRLLMQSLEVQDEYMALLREEIKKFVQTGIGSHGIAEFPPTSLGCTISRSCFEDFSILTEYGYTATLTLHTFIIDRTRTWPRGIKKTAKFYQNVYRGITDVAIVVHEDNSGNVPKYYLKVPYRQEGIVTTSRHPHLKELISELVAKQIWKARLDSMSKHVGCIHKINHRKCLPNCMLKWGRTMFYILTGDVLCVWDDLEKDIKKVVLVKTGYMEEGENKHVVGILIKEENVGFVNEIIKCRLPRYVRLDDEECLPEHVTLNDDECLPENASSDEETRLSMSPD